MNSRLSHQEAISRARNYVQARASKVQFPFDPESPELQQPMISANTSMGAVQSPSGVLRYPRRKADVMHKDLQMTAFGATFAASGLSELQQSLLK
jgi:hypothetical protein